MSRIQEAGAPVRRLSLSETRQSLSDAQRIGRWLRDLLGKTGRGRSVAAPVAAACAATSVAAIAVQAHVFDIVETRESVSADGLPAHSSPYWGVQTEMILWQ